MWAKLPTTWCRSNEQFMFSQLRSTIRDHLQNWQQKYSNNNLQSSDQPQVKQTQQQIEDQQTELNLDSLI